jgi:hypothetical protein
LQEVTITLRGNVDKIPVYFDMPSNYTINNVVAKSDVIKMSCIGKVLVTVMLTGLADST